MYTAFSDTLSQLSKDHVAFRRALNILERQVEKVAQHDRPDFDILTGVVAYFQQYPGRFHHPAEHLIYTALQRRLPMEADGIAFVEQQHGEIAHELAIFARVVHDILSDAELSRRAFCHAARAFIDFERRHIRGEETSLFYLAVSKLSPADWLTIDDAARSLWAPLSQKEEMAHFAKLHEDLVTWDMENTSAMPELMVP